MFMFHNFSRNSHKFLKDYDYDGELLQNVYRIFPENMNGINNHLGRKLSDVIDPIQIQPSVKSSV